MKGIDPKPSPPEVRSNAYQVGEPVCVKPLDCQCTTRFCKGLVNNVINPQTVLVNGTPHHVKDLRRHDELAIIEEDESDTSSGSEMGGVMVTYESEDQHSSAQLTTEEDTKDEDDQTSGDRRKLTEEHPTLPQRSTWQKQASSPCHICNHEIRGSVVKIGVKIATHLSTNVRAYAPCTRYSLYCKWSHIFTPAVT